MRRLRSPTGLLAAAAIIIAALVIGATVASRREREVEPDRSATETFAIPGHPSALVVAKGVVWIADDDGHSVHTIDARTGKRVGRSIPVARNPVALAAGGDSVWVAHASGSVVRIDMASRHADPPIAAGESITGIAVSVDRVWAADLPGNALAEIDARSSRVLRRVPIPEGAVRVVAAGPYLWVTNRERTVTRVRASDGEVASPVEVGIGPIGAASDGRRVWVANSEDGTVSRIDVATGAEVAPAVEVGRGPVAVAVSGRTVAVANQDEGTVSLVRRTSGEVTAEPVFIGLRPRGIAAYGNRIWVVGRGGPPANQGAAVRVDLERVS